MIIELSAQDVRRGHGRYWMARNSIGKWIGLGRNVLRILFYGKGRKDQSRDHVFFFFLLTEGLNCRRLRMLEGFREWMVWNQLWVQETFLVHSQPLKMGTLNQLLDWLGGKCLVFESDSGPITSLHNHWFWKQYWTLHG